MKEIDMHCSEELVTFVDEPDWDPWEPLRIEREAEEGVWTTGKGTQIPVQEMSTSHIKNTIAYIQRVDTIDMYAPWIEVFHKELKQRGDK